MPLSPFIKCSNILGLINSAAEIAQRPYLNRSSSWYYIQPLTPVTTEMLMLMTKHMYCCVLEVYSSASFTSVTLHYAYFRKTNEKPVVAFTSKQVPEIIIFISFICMCHIPLNRTYFAFIQPHNEKQNTTVKGFNI